MKDKRTTPAADEPAGKDTIRKPFPITSKAGNADDELSPDAPTDLGDAPTEILERD